MLIEYVEVTGEWVLRLAVQFNKLVQEIKSEQNEQMANLNMSQHMGNFGLFAVYFSKYTP